MNNARMNDISKPDQLSSDRISVDSHLSQRSNTHFPWCIIPLSYALVKKIVKYKICFILFNISDSDSKCEVLRNGSSSIELSCVMKFRGNWSPMMQWSISNGPTLATNNVVVLNQSVTSVLRPSLLSEFSTRELVHVTCETLFTLDFKFDENKAATQAKNIPEYRYVWYSPLIKTVLSEYNYSKSAPITIMCIIIVNENE